MTKIQLLSLLVCVITACDTQTNQRYETQAGESIQSYTLEFAEPEELGLNIDSLKKIDETIMKYVRNKRFPGGVVLIAKNGKIVYETEVGWSDSLQTEPYTKDHIFRIGSMTKPITSVAAMQLIEEGKLALEDPVSDYIPTFLNSMVLISFNEEDTTWESRAAHRPPTIKDLLTHTAGVPYGFSNKFGAILATKKIPNSGAYQDFTIGEKMADLGSLPLAHDPGEQWMYGLNTDVLGSVIEVVSGMTLGEYIRTNITKPLKMNDMAFFLDEEQTKRLAELYKANEDSLITYYKPHLANKLNHPNYPIRAAKKYFSGGSGMSGTARDYFVFSQMMLNGGSFNGIQILKPETAQSMHTNQIDTLSYPFGTSRFGFGFDIAYNQPVRPDGTYRWGGAYSTDFWIDPENDLIAVFMSQVLFSPDRSSLRNEFEKALYNALVKKKLVVLE